jgi:hypothetical protein
MDKLQRAGRDSLICLVATHGLDGAARVLRALADELDCAQIESGCCRGSKGESAKLG